MGWGVNEFPTDANRGSDTSRETQLGPVDQFAATTRKSYFPKPRPFSEKPPQGVISELLFLVSVAV